MEPKTEPLSSFMEHRLTKMSYLKSTEFEEIVRRVQNAAFSNQVRDIPFHKYNSAIDSLCNIIIEFCNDPKYKGQEKYMSQQIAAVIYALNI